MILNKELASHQIRGLIIKVPPKVTSQSLHLLFYCFLGSLFWQNGGNTSKHLSGALATSGNFHKFLPIFTVKDPMEGRAKASQGKPKTPSQGKSKF